MTNKSTFWCVWNPSAGSPTVQHHSHESALAEAKRLAERVPGQRFFVLQAINVVERVSPVMVTNLDVIPF